VLFSHAERDMTKNVSVPSSPSSSSSWCEITKRKNRLAVENSRVKALHKMINDRRRLALFQDDPVLHQYVKSIDGALNILNMKPHLLIGNGTFPRKEHVKKITENETKNEKANRVANLRLTNNRDAKRCRDRKRVIKTKLNLDISIYELAYAMMITSKKMDKKARQLGQVKFLDLNRKKVEMMTCCFHKAVEMLASNLPSTISS
jgi:hypothetical protein